MTAEQGQRDAPSKVASWYNFGRGVEQSDVEAAKWYTKAAEQGHADAQFSLGVMYDQGRGVEQSDVEAVKWYTRAAVQGHADAQFNLGLMNEQGRGVEQSDVEAVKWYTRAAMQGYAAAQYNLGVMYYQGEGVEQNDVEAVKWYTRASEQGYSVAQFNLGLVYELGIGVEQSNAMALDLFHKAAENGEPSAHFHVQWLVSLDHTDGRTPVDTADAVSLYRQGAERRYAAAQHNLARMYDKGRGVARDKKEAIAWYSKAADQGHEDAKQRMEVLQSTWIKVCFTLVMLDERRSALLLGPSISSHSTCPLTTTFKRQWLKRSDAVWREQAAGPSRPHRYFFFTGCLSNSHKVDLLSTQSVYFPHSPSTFHISPPLSRILTNVCP